MLDAALWVDFTKYLAGLLAVVDPIGIIPLFIAMTQSLPPVGKKRVARNACLTGLIVMLVVIVSGQAILDFFGIRVAAFQIVGGLLMLWMGFEMLNANHSSAHNTPEETAEAVTRSEVAIVPLGIPLIAGPGTISALILYSQQSKDWQHSAAIAAACLVTVLLTYLTFRLATPLARLLGQTGVNVVTRIMGLILAAIAVEFCARGLGGLFPCAGLGTICTPI